MSAKGERWRPVLGWEGLYEVSDAASIRGLDGRTPYMNRNGKKGGIRVMLSRPGDGRTGTTLAKCVWEAFNGRLPRSKMVGYRDGDRGNCSLANLKLFRRGRARLDDDTVKAIKERLKTARYGDLSKIARAVGVSPSSISLMGKGKRHREENREPTEAGSKRGGPPTKAEIQRRCRKIREEWSPEELAKRAGVIQTASEWDAEIGGVPMTVPTVRDVLAEVA